MGVMELFKTILMIMLFYSFSITVLVYAIPADVQSFSYMDVFTNVDDTYSVQEIGGKVEGSLQSQTSIPVVELGALVFYSGNIVLDLILNFLTAIPQMFGMLINGLQMLIGINGYLFAQVEAFFVVLFGVIYIIGIIELVTNIRSGGNII